MKNGRKGFTLIEILIVVAIIAILASVILVGLGPTQSLGRDARRVSDLQEIQNGLELYYNANGQYPDTNSTAAWGPATTANTFSYDLVNAGIGISSVPSDPSSGRSYDYGYATNGTSYILEATLENGSGGPWDSYTAPSANAVASDTSGGYLGAAKPACTESADEYCVTL